MRLCIVTNLEGDDDGRTEEVTYEMLASGEAFFAQTT
jgi:hypothetical protein